MEVSDEGTESENEEEGNESDGESKKKVTALYFWVIDAETVEQYWFVHRNLEVLHSRKDLMMFSEEYFEVYMMRLLTENMKVFFFSDALIDVN